MMAAEVRWLWLTVLLAFICGSFGNAPFRRFEYKYSFKPPYLAQKDGSVPFWEYGGNAIASSENVRIAPSLRSQKGAIWTKSKTNFDWWEVDIVFRISGRGRLGADGLAFWYTENKGSYDGQVFGSSDKWNGLGIFFDSFDNDNKHNNPYIMAVVNDGTKEFDHQQDGQTQLLAGCVRDFRNKPFPSRARIEYYQNVLTVFFHTGLSNNELDSDVCLRVENVFLPKTGFFGLSAATGGLADDHDVMHFLATSLHTPGHVPPPVGATRVSEEEQKKLSEEYADYQRKLDQQKEEYRREHPEAAKDKESEFDELFESDNQRELRQIFMGQSETYDKLREIDRKLDEVVGRQERTISLISTITTAGGTVVRNDQYPQISDTIKRHEVDAVLTNQNSIISASKDLKNLLLEIHSRTETIIQTQAKQPTAQVQPVGGDTATLASLVAELREAAASQRTACNCSTAGCLSVTVFLVFAAVQLLIILGYNIYKDSREAQAKKFY